jgi:hypothetical protein
MAGFLRGAGLESTPVVAGSSRLLFFLFSFLLLDLLLLSTHLSSLQQLVLRFDWA